MIRQVTVALLSAMAIVRACTPPWRAPITQGTTESFRRSVGVNLHLQYGDTLYGSAQRVRWALSQLGVVYVRDSGLRRGEEGGGRYLELGRTSVRYDLFANAADLPAQLDRIARLARAAPGAVVSLEGPNEVNNDPIQWANRSGEAGAQAYQAALYAGAHARRELKGLPILGYTDWPPAGGRADVVNVHSYPRPGQNIGDRLRHDLALSASALPRGLPVQVTEIGFSTGPPSSAAPFVSPRAQADAVLIALLEAYRAGVQRTYLYELFDESKSGAPSDPEGHYGLFDGQGAPKPAARVLARLMRSLGRLDSGPIRAPLPAITIQGARSLILTGASGSALLILWRPRLMKGAPVAAIVFARPVVVTQVDLGDDSAARARVAASWRSHLDGSPQVYVLSAVASASRPLAPSKRPVAISR